MKITVHPLEKYDELEQDLCSLHAASDAEEVVDREYADIRSKFATSFPCATHDDYGFPEWHHNLRMLWVYLYSDVFYTPELLRNLQRITESMEMSWFMQFECYSPSLESDELPTGYLGHFLVYKDSVIVCEDENSAYLVSKIQEAQQD